MALKYQYPFPIGWYDTSDPFGGFGNPPFRTSSHKGSDFNGGSSGVAGTPIPAVAAGTVVYSDWYDGLGNVVSIQHPDGYFSGYCHMTARSVSNGATVARGATVGTVGGTRTSTASYAPHLHLTMGTDSAGTRGGGSCFDPIPFIAARLNGDDTTTPTEGNQEMKLIRQAGNVRAALIGETAGATVYTTSEIPWRGGINTKAWGETTGLTDAEFDSLVNEANARKVAFVNAIAVAVAAQAPTANLTFTPADVTALAGELAPKLPKTISGTLS